MLDSTPRVAVIQDLSCIGRCSLGVMMAVLPVMGVEAAVLPTAILSTHTAFEGFTFLDFTPEAEKIMLHWKELNMTFDAIVIGYLGSIQLIELAKRFIKLFARDNMLVIVDPAFGDNGKLYKGFDDNYVRNMRVLCAEADIILPNVTEICYLLDMPHNTDAKNCKRIAEASKALLGERLRNVLITSCNFDDNQMGLICAGDNAFEYPHEQLPLACHGTGDLFASVFAGLMLKTRDVQTSACFAADFTRDSIRHSMECADHRWYGADFEKMLPSLAQKLYKTI